MEELAGSCSTRKVQNFRPTGPPTDASWPTIRNGRITDTSIHGLPPSGLRHNRRSLVPSCSTRLTREVHPSRLREGEEHLVGSLIPLTKQGASKYTSGTFPWAPPSGRFRTTAACSHTGAATAASCSI